MRITFAEWIEQQIEFLEILTPDHNFIFVECCIQGGIVCWPWHPHIKNLSHPFEHHIIWAWWTAILASTKGRTLDRISLNSLTAPIAKSLNAWSTWSFCTSIIIFDSSVISLQLPRWNHINCFADSRFWMYYKFVAFDKLKEVFNVKRKNEHTYSSNPTWRQKDINFLQWIIHIN